MDQTPIFKQLFLRYLEGDYTVADFQQIQAYLAEDVYRQACAQWIQEVLHEDAQQTVSKGLQQEQQIERVITKLDAQLGKHFPGLMIDDAQLEAPVRSVLYRSIYRWTAVAASIMVLVLTITWFLLERSPDAPQHDSYTQTEISPGVNKAFLTLSDGRVVELSDTYSEIVFNGDDDVSYQDGSSVWNKSEDNGGISDDSREQGSDGIPGINTNYSVLRTPQGGTYSITLPDGSKVWLNAGSTLKYPSRFSGSERLVELEGEAFFEVRQIRKSANPQHNEAVLQPFRVVSKNQTVEVLGTKFNMSAYADDPETKTTLITGSVKVTALRSNTPHLLTPGEQAITQGAKTYIETVDIPQVIAWQQGDFRFAGNMEGIMKQIARWYDVEVVFSENNLKKEAVLAIVKRDRPLVEVLAILEESAGVKFQVRERRVIIMR